MKTKVEELIEFAPTRITQGVNNDLIKKYINTIFKSDFVQTKLTGLLEAQNINIHTHKGGDNFKTLSKHNIATVFRLKGVDTVSIVKTYVLTKESSPAGEDEHTLVHSQIIPYETLVNQLVYMDALNQIFKGSLKYDKSKVVMRFAHSIHSNVRDVEDLFYFITQGATVDKAPDGTYDIECDLNNAICEKFNVYKAINGRDSINEFKIKVDLLSNDKIYTLKDELLSK